MPLKSTIMINDQFTKPLQDMSNALNMTISHFERLQEVSENPIPVEDLRYAREQLGNVDVALKQMKPSIDLNTQAQKQFNDTVKLSSLNFKELLMNVTKLNIARKVIQKATQELRKGFTHYRTFTKEMGELKGVTQATAQEMDYLNNRAKVLGSTTLFDATEATQGMIRLAKGGMNVYEVLTSVDDALNLAMAGTLDLDHSAGILVDVMRGFNLTANDTERIVDTIAYTANSATTDIGRMGDSLRETASVAKTFNATFEETSVLIKMMSNTFKGTRAGRAVRRGLGQIATPGEKAQEWMNALKVDFIDPATRELKGITTIVDDLAQAFIDYNLTGQQQIEATKALFGEQMYAGWLDIIKRGPGAMDKELQELVENSAGYGKELAENMMKSTDGVLKLFSNRISSIWVEFYDRLAGTMTGDAFLEILNALALVFQFALKLAEVLITVLGGAIMFVKNNFDLLIPVLGITLGLFIGMKGAVMGIVGVFMIVISVISLGIAVVNRFGTTSITVAEFFGGAFSVAVAIVKNAFIGLYNLTMVVMVGITNGVTLAVDSIRIGFTNATNKAKEVMYSLGNYALDVLSKIAGAMDKLFGSNLAGAVGQWSSSLQGWYENAIKDVPERGELLDINEYTMDYVDIAGAWNDGKNLGNQVVGNIKDFFSYGVDPYDIDGLFSDEFDDLLDGINDMNTGLGNALGDIGKDAKKTANNTDKLGEEDLKYLIDLATVRAVNRFVTTEVKVEFDNDFSVNSELDVDGVINDINEGLSEVVKVTMEGI